MKHASALATLIESPEPSLRWRARIGILREDGSSRSMQALREEIRMSPRVRALLARRDARGRIDTPHGVYDKWQGAHWVLARLADLGNVDWGGTSSRKMNPWVTADALGVLVQAGRWLPALSPLPAKWASKLVNIAQRPSGAL